MSTNALLRRWSKRSAGDLKMSSTSENSANGSGRGCSGVGCTRKPNAGHRRYDFGELVFYRQLDAEAVVIIAPGVLGVDLLADASSVAERLYSESSSPSGNLTIVEKEVSAAVAGEEMNKDPDSRFRVV